jgi:hypothetical protein
LGEKCDIEKISIENELSKISTGVNNFSLNVNEETKQKIGSEEQSTMDEGYSSITSKTIKMTSDIIQTLKNQNEIQCLKKLLNTQNDNFQDSVLKYIILNSESKIKNISNKDSLMKDLSKYDQYLMNDNMEFLSVILTLLYSKKDCLSLQDPLIRQILKLLIKRLLNTTDNYIQCEKSFSMILTKYTKNVRERFSDLKSYLLNQKLKNMADLKIKTNTLVKKMNMTLDSVGGKNTQVSSAVNKRHDQIEGFVGNYVEREEYSRLNLKKILADSNPLEIPQLKGKFFQFFLLINQIWS